MMMIASEKVKKYGKIFEIMVWNKLENRQKFLTLVAFHPAYFQIQVLYTIIKLFRVIFYWYWSTRNGDWLIFVLHNLFFYLLYDLHFYLIMTLFSSTQMCLPRCSLDSRRIDQELANVLQWKKIGVPNV